MATKREGISLAGFFQRFPDDAAAEEWFVAQRWPTGVTCAHCAGGNVSAVKNRRPQPYHCRDCRRYFSAKTNTVMHSSKLGYRTWLLAIYLLATNAKGCASTKLARDLDVQQKTAWHLAHRIRKAMAAADSAASDLFSGPVEVDEAYLGGVDKWRHANKRERVGGGAGGKTPVIGMVDQATNRVAAVVVDRATSDAATGFVKERVAAGAAVYTDGSGIYKWLGQLGYRHEAVDHASGEYVRDGVTTNAVESLWALSRRQYRGTHHWMSPKHLPRYVGELAARHNMRPLATMDRMAVIAGGMEGERLLYADLTAPLPEPDPPPEPVLAVQPRLGGVRWD